MSSNSANPGYAKTFPPHVGVLYGAGSSLDARYLEEILSHAGVFYEDVDDEAGFDSLPPLVVVAGGTLGTRPREAVARHVADGGALLCLATTGGLDDVLGVTDTRPCEPGWIDPVGGPHAAAVVASAPLHVFGGWPENSSKTKFVQHNKYTNYTRYIYQFSTIFLVLPSP